MKRILVIIPYFGKWPPWFKHYLKSCELNPTIDWLFFSNAAPPARFPPNVSFETLEFKDYRDLVSKRLGLKFQCVDTYKLCDIRPALGVIHADRLKGYDLFGYGDIDVIYGNLRKFYTDEVLSHLCVSSHEEMLSGHLAFVQNNERGINAFRQVFDWERIFANPWHHCFDEKFFSRLFLSGPFKGEGYFKEQFSTILTRRPWIDQTMAHPEVWFWKNGRLTNDKDGNREFPYFHFMNWKSSRYLAPAFTKPAAWEKLKKVPFVPLSKAKEGWMMTRKGFLPLKDL